MKIEFGDFLIRNANVDDSSILYKWWNDKQLVDAIDFPFGVNVKEEEMIIQLANDKNHLILEYKNTPIGEIIYHDVGYRTAKLMVRICILSQRDKGYGKLFIAMMLNILFYELDHEKIVIETDLDNIRAQHVFSSLGFNKIRVNMDCYKDHHDNMHSFVEYELYRDEFTSQINRKDLVYHPQADR